MRQFELVSAPAVLSQLVEYEVLDRWVGRLAAARIPVLRAILALLITSGELRDCENEGDVTHEEEGYGKDSPC